MTKPSTQPGASLKSELLAAIPSLRAFAMSLSGNIDRADDLVQETLVKAWSNLGSFTEGTNMSAWLFTILRNLFYSEYRKRRREVADADGQIAGKLASIPSQNAHMDFLDFQEALQQLSPDQREALILVGASGMSYEEAAEICGCAVGTMKSRVNRARNRLAQLLSVSAEVEFGPEPQWQAGIDSRARLASVGE
jgi:RNA polymerase sigma-70 factor (ECF subfamily)